MTKSFRVLGTAFGLWLLCLPARADDWPVLGRDKTRNAVSPEKNPPQWWQPPITVGPDRRAGKNIKWEAPLPHRTKCDPVVANGLVWVGSRERLNKGRSASVLACYREKDGKLLYQYRVPDPAEGVGTWDAGHTSSPLIEADRLWFTTPSSETVCLDVGPLRRGDGEPKELWKVDMIKQLRIFPSYAPMGYGKTCSIPASYKDRIYVCTGNAANEEGKVPQPKAPSLVCFDKNTGKVLWSDNSPGDQILDRQWCSPLVMDIAGRGQVVTPQGDGWLRSFDAMTGELLWKFDTNLRSITQPDQRSRLLATPVYHDGYIYIGNGHSPVDSPSLMPHFFCIDPTKRGDISPEVDAGQGKSKPNPNSGLVWRHGGRDGKRRIFDGTMSSAAISDGLVIVAETNGYLNCLDAKTGKPYWRYDVLAELPTAPLIVDKTIFAASDIDLHHVALAKDLMVQARVELEGSTFAAPIFANGVLFLATSDKLYAIAGQEKPTSVKDPSAKKTHRAPDAVFVPTPQDIVEEMLTLAKVKKTDLVYDLGCGDGRIVVTAAKKFGCRAIGVDLDPDCINLAREKVKRAKVGDLVTIEQTDLFTVDLSHADVVALYLLPKLNVKLLPQLAKLKPGARVVSHTFPIEGYQPDRIVRKISAHDGVEHRIYLWTVPLKKADGK